MSRWTASRWLTAFRAVGEIVWIHSGGHVGIAYRVLGFSSSDNQEACRLAKEILDWPGRYDALSIYVGLTS